MKIAHKVYDIGARAADRGAAGAHERDDGRPLRTGRLRDRVDQPRHRVRRTTVRCPQVVDGVKAGMGNNGALTIPSNIYGNPAISIPIGTSRGLPIGMQVLAPHHREALAARPRARSPSANAPGPWSRPDGPFVVANCLAIRVRIRDQERVGRGVGEEPTYITTVKSTVASMRPLMRIVRVCGRGAPVRAQRQRSVAARPTRALRSVGS